MKNTTIHANALEKELMGQINESVIDEAKKKQIIITFTTQKGGQHQQAIFDAEIEKKDAEHFIKAVPDWGKLISVKHK